MESCKICSGKNGHFATATVLKRHTVAFYRCGSCGFVQTEVPHWLEEAYSDAIAASDLGLVHRNLRLARLTQSLISVCFNPGGMFLDYGGGCGLLVRLMRDAGFDFRLYDRYCRNVLAQGFDLTGEEAGSFELVTTFELLEHVHDPVAELESLLAYSRNILFTTELYPQDKPLPDQWWYFGLDHGQHVSFFTQQSLEALAKRLSLNLYSNGTSIHLLTEKPLSPLLFDLALRQPVAKVVNLLCRRPSLLPTDYETLSRNRKP